AECAAGDAETRASRCSAGEGGASGAACPPVSGGARSDPRSSVARRGGSVPRVTLEVSPSVSPSVSRCSARVAASASGFALATQPVSAHAITTSSDGLHTAEIDIPTGQGELPGYLARPKRGTSFPVVLVVQEIFGVHEHIKGLARRLAHEGYLAIAPELYARVGDVGKLSSIEEIRQVVAQVPDDQVLADLDAA